MRYWSIILLLVHASLCAQINHVTFGKDHKIRINANGSLAIDLADLSPQSYRGTNERLAFLAQAGLWISATDEFNKKHTAVQYLTGKDSFDFWPGPLDTLTGQAADISTWNTIWLVSAAEIEVHKTKYLETGYIMPEHIRTWPGNGAVGYSKYLAPFVDANNNQIYDPENGDYPAIKGEQSAYLIFNDLASEHNASLGLNIGLEVQLMAYTKSSSDAIFLDYYIIGRKELRYTSINVGFFIKAQCGNALDNYAGTLQANPQAVFIYNADDTDEGYFEQNTPYITALFLDNNLSNSIAFSNSQPKNSQPEKSIDFSNYAEGNWLDGSPLTYGGNGMNSGSRTPFIYAQSPDITPLWSEEQSSNVSGQRTILGVLPSTSFQKNDFIRLSVAISAGTSDFNSLKTNLITTSRFIKNEYWASEPKMELENNVKIYPNPINSHFFIENINESFDIYITDYKGIKIPFEKIITKNTIECNINVPPGIYIMYLKTKNQVIVKKLCKQK